MMTYKELIQQLQSLTEEQLNCDVIVNVVDDVFQPINTVINSGFVGIIDQDRPYLTYDRSLKG